MKEDYEEVEMICTSCRTKVIMPREVYNRIKYPSDNAKNILDRLDASDICCWHPNFTVVPIDTHKDEMKFKLRTSVNGTISIVNEGVFVGKETIRYKFSTPDSDGNELSKELDKLNTGDTITIEFKKGYNKSKLHRTVHKNEIFDEEDE